MHSRILRGADFSIREAGQPVSHATFFRKFAETDRLALLAPQGVEGLGAACLLLGFVTAYYDHWRREGSEAVRYPEFFTLQNNLPCADYCMLDIWPYHRNLYCPDEDAAWTALAARGVSIVIVPDGHRTTAALPADCDCYTYSRDGVLDESNIEIGLPTALIRDYLMAVIDSLPQASAEMARSEWRQRLAQESLVQQFRKIGANGADSQG